METLYEELLKSFHDIHAQLRQALEALPPEALDWTPGKDMNSPAVLITHITGSERFLIGDILMLDPSTRDRDTEFQVKGITREDLLRRLDNTEAYLDAALAKLTLPDLVASRPHPHRDGTVAVAWILLHALQHAAAHLGHLQLTVQLWKQK